VSQPPEYPGSRRLKRAAARAGGGAYEGAFEAVGSILIAIGLGYWFDQHYETTPVGVLVGACIGFAAFVLRLLRMGRRLQAESTAREEAPELDAGSGRSFEDERFAGEGLGLSDVLRERSGEREDASEEPGDESVEARRNDER